MAYNKFMDRVGNVLLDLTDDTVTENDVLLGKTFHDKTGVQKIGAMSPSSEGSEAISDDKVNFFDYDGTLIASYTVEEAQQLTALPPLPDHTDDNLTCEGWTETLEFVNSLTRPFNIGATYHTTDGYTYLYMALYDPNNLSPKIRIYNVGGTITIYWGDGSNTESSTTGLNSLQHTYSTTGEYVIKIISTGNYYFQGSNSSSSYSFGPNIAYQNGITKAKLSNQITKFNGYDFYYCYSLEYINVPNSVTSIGGSVFYQCYTLKALTLPNNANKVIQSYFLQSCYLLSKINIPSSINTIGNSAFYGCRMLSNVTLPDGLVAINSGAFGGECSLLKNIVIPDSVSAIESGCFASAKILKRLIIPNGVTVIRSNLLYYCAELESVTIPNSVTAIEYDAMKYCYSLESIVIPNSVTSIGNSAFYQCYNLKEVDLTSFETVPALGTSVFYMCAKLKLKISSDMIEQFRTAPNWSTWAHMMVSV